MEIEYGKVAFTPKGEYKSILSYDFYDMCYNGTKVVISLKDNNISPLSDTQAWRTFIELEQPIVDIFLVQIADYLNEHLDELLSGVQNEVDEIKGNLGDLDTLFDSHFTDLTERLEDVMAKAYGSVRRVKIGNGSWIEPDNGSLQLPAYPTSLPANGGTAESVSGVIPIIHGGTGATSAAGARNNLALGTAATKNVGVAYGVASLGADGKVPASELPSYVDDVVDVEGCYEYNSHYYQPLIEELLPEKRLKPNPTTSDFNNSTEITFVAGHIYRVIGSDYTGTGVLMILVNGVPTRLIEETDKIYVDVVANKTFRWTGTVLFEIASGNIDPVPTENSSNAVSSGGVKMALDTEHSYFAARAERLSLELQPSPGTLFEIDGTAKTLTLTCAAKVETFNEEATSYIAPADMSKEVTFNTESKDDSDMTISGNNSIAEFDVPVYVGTFPVSYSATYNGAVKTKSDVNIYVNLRKFFGFYADVPEDITDLGANHFSNSVGCTVTIPANYDAEDESDELFKYIYFAVPVGMTITRITQPDALNAPLAFEYLEDEDIEREIDGETYAYKLYRSASKIDSSVAKRLTIA